MSLFELLCSDQLGICPILLFNKSFMPPVLLNGPISHYNNAVSIPHCRESMRNDDGGSTGGSGGTLQIFKYYSFAGACMEDLISTDSSLSIN